MTNNVGSADRIIRIILGVVIIGIGYYYRSWWGLVGIIPLATATLNFCPLYVPFKINTSGK